MSATVSRAAGLAARAGALAADLRTTASALARLSVAGATVWSAGPAWARDALQSWGTGDFRATTVPVEALTATLRASARPGDALVVVGGAGDVLVADVLRRAPAWGLATVLVGAGTRTRPGAADHVLWLADGRGPTARREAVLRLHRLLVGLTHRRTARPDLLLPAPACSGPTCLTCADEGRLAEVVSVADASTALVRAGGSVEAVDVTLVGEVGPGDLLVIHAGSAIAAVAP